MTDEQREAAERALRQGFTYGTVILGAMRDTAKIEKNEEAIRAMENAISALNYAAMGIWYYLHGQKYDESKTYNESLNEAALAITKTINREHFQRTLQSAMNRIMGKDGA